MTRPATPQDLEALARIIDPPAWLEHDDLIKRAEGWERANQDRSDETFLRMAQGRRRDAGELVRLSLSKAEKAWAWCASSLAWGQATEPWQLETLEALKNQRTMDWAHFRSLYLNVVSPGEANGGR